LPLKVHSEEAGYIQTILVKFDKGNNVVCYREHVPRTLSSSWDSADERGGSGW
jgi:hypothetical protein